MKQSVNKTIFGRLENKCEPFFFKHPNTELWSDEQSLI